ncbi:MAG: DUF4274 domain-containing protein [Chloroflexota bacterium]|nr:DUF4274 domain-containing protein [Chloroflexota bacterium]
MTVYSLAEIEKIASPQELHELILHYNWDDGVEIPCVVSNNENCDRETVLMIYWLAGPGYLYQYENWNEIERNYEGVQFDLIEEIERKYLAGFYQNNTILFNPRYDAGNDGYDHTQTYDDFVKKRKIPDEMFEPSIPDLKWEAMGRPIKPIKKVDYKEWYKSLDDEISKLEMDEE